MSLALPERLRQAILDTLATPVASYPTPGDLAQALDPRIRQTRALDLIDQAIVDTIGTPDGRLILSMPPQEGKSQRAGIATPIWQLLRNPDTRIAIASYGQGLANRNGRAIRNAIIAHPELGMTIAADNGAASEWTLAGHQGGVLSVGRGAGITGRPVDCVSGDAHIECEHGTLTAADAFARGITRILAFDHTSGRAVWRDVEATRRIECRGVIEIVTEAGRVLACTPDHRVYTSRGYVPAGSLALGDEVVAVVDAGRVPLRDGLPSAAAGSAESHRAGPVGVLLPDLHGGDVREGEPHSLVCVRKPDSAQPQRDVLAGVSGSAGATAVSRLRSVRGVVPAAAHVGPVLHEGMRRHGALDADDRAGQPALQDWQELCQVVQVDAPVDFGAGRESLCRVRGVSDDSVPAWRRVGDQVGPDGASHRRGHGEQRRGESDHALRGVPHDAPQVERDAIRLVLRSGIEKVDVYDFQVEGARNFFAEGVLVHNCLIIDDPLKDRAEADSETIRDTCQDWWTDSLSTRLAPGAPVIMILTRWHSDDLAGRLTSSPDGHLWRVINIPAQAESDDPLGRQPGEWLDSARGDRDWPAIRTRVGARTWNALYQGRPSPAEGGLIKREWWRRYAHPLWTVREDGSLWAHDMDEVLISADLAFKGTTTSDFVAIGVWGRRGSDVYLLDQVHGLHDFVSTLRAFEALCVRWPQAVLKLVEDKANGPALIAMLSRRIPGIVPVEPKGGKVQRAEAWAPLAESGHVWIPEQDIARFDVDGFVEEMAAFPNGSHDDQVDQTSQALDRMLLRPLLAGQTYTDDLDDLGDWRIGY